MPPSQHITTSWLRDGIFLLLLLETLQWSAQSWADIDHDFSISTGLNMLLVFQAGGIEILRKAYITATGDSNPRVVENRATECAGYLLSFVVQASTVFCLGGRGFKDMELRHRERVMEKWWPAGIAARFYEVNYWGVVTARLAFIASWSAAFADSPLVSRIFILFVDRLVRRFDGGATKAQFLA